MTATPEDELEAAIWQAMKLCAVTTADPLTFIESLMFAAQRYAAGDGPVITAQRRGVLHDARTDIGGGEFRWGHRR